MFVSTRSRRLSAIFASLVATVVGLTAAVAASGATEAPDGAKPATHRTTERLVVRGDDTVQDGVCTDGSCVLELAGGAFRGTLGTGAYEGTIDLRVADSFANGEDGVCAPIDGSIVLGAGSSDTLVVALSGDSCQDGSGDLTQASFTGVARFVVKGGTGKYANASGSGLATFAEDATDHERMTLIGRISRSLAM